jgi:hypothetical protein
MIALGDPSVLAKLKIGTAFVVLICLAHALPPRGALAITAEVAKKCGALSDKAYPPRVVGNPAAGRQNGTIQDFRIYFNKCVANGGNPPEQENKDNAQSPDGGNDKNSQAPKQNQ